MPSNLPPGTTQQDLDDRVYTPEVFDEASKRFNTSLPTMEQLEETLQEMETRNEDN